MCVHAITFSMGNVTYSCGRGGHFGQIRGDARVIDPFSNCNGLSEYFVCAVSVAVEVES